MGLDAFSIIRSLFTKKIKCAAAHEHRGPLLTALELRLIAHLAKGLAENHEIGRPNFLVAIKVCSNVKVWVAQK